MTTRKVKQADVYAVYVDRETKHVSRIDYRSQDGDGSLMINGFKNVEGHVFLDGFEQFVIELIPNPSTNDYRLSEQDDFWVHDAAMQVLTGEPL
jgi:hypothetical protein